MSDFHQVSKKLKEGAEWRGTIDVTIDGEQQTLSVRQLRDPEFEEVMSKVSRSELQDYREALPEDLSDEFQELQDKEELDEDEEERLAEVEAELEEKGPSIFEFLSTETMSGIRLAGKYAVVPDDDDKIEAFQNRAQEIESEHGIKVSVPDDVEDVLKEEMRERLDNATNFVSFQIGMSALMETVGDEGN